MRILILILPFLLCFTCTKLAEPKRLIFRPPVILYDYEPDSLRKFEAQSIVPNAAILLGGTFPFTDTLNFLSENTQAVARPFEGTKGDLPHDTLAGDGLEIFPDYKKSFYLNRYRPFDRGTSFYPVYIANQSPNPKALHGRDAYVIAIQEAQDSSGWLFSSWIRYRIKKTCEILKSHRPSHKI